MKSRMKLTLGGIVLLALALLMPGCEDSELTAPSDGLLSVTVNPGTVTIDPNVDDPPEGEANIIASLFDIDGRPLQNVAILFSADGGTLESNNTSINTDANGLAVDSIIVDVNDPPLIAVTAQSASLSATDDLTVQVVLDNIPPVASIIDDPMGEQEVGKMVLFDGSASTDPDGNITCYQWTVNSDVDSSDDVLQGSGLLSWDKRYQEIQTLVVTLRVSDRGDAGSMCNGTEILGTEYFNGSDSITYQITCANQPPTAEAGPDQEQVFGGGTGNLVRLDGSRSTDPEGALDSWKWDCGNGTQALPGPSPQISYCNYTAIGTWIATLTVGDRGNGTMSGGTWQCQKFDEDTAAIIIRAPEEAD